MHARVQLRGRWVGMSVNGSENLVSGILLPSLKQGLLLAIVSTQG